MLRIILYTFLVGVVGTMIGGIIGAIFGHRSEKSMSLLLSFSGGIMISIVCFDLIIDAIELSSIFITASVSILGVIIIMILNDMIDSYNDKRKNSSSQVLKQNSNKYKLLKSGIVMIVAIGLHNFPEGLAVGSSLSFDFKSGLFLALLIAFHNIPEGMAISAPLMGGGVKRIKAILLSALAGAPTILGAMLGFLVGGTSSLGVAISLSFAGGAMLYVVFYEIIPQTILMNESKMPSLFVLIGMLIGLVVITMQ